MLKLLKLGTARFAGTASFIKMPPLKKLAGTTRYVFELLPVHVLNLVHVASG